MKRALNGKTKANHSETSTRVPVSRSSIWREMATAAAQTIHDRTQRMARAGLSPSARDRKEFLLMGQEKLEAASDGFQPAPCADDARADASADGGLVRRGARYIARVDDCQAPD